MFNKKRNNKNASFRFIISIILGVVVIAVFAVFVLLKASSLFQQQSQSQDPSPLTIECPATGTGEEVVEVNYNTAVIKTGETHDDDHGLTPLELQEIGQNLCDDLMEQAERECIEQLRVSALGGRDFVCDNCPEGFQGNCDRNITLDEEELGNGDMISFGICTFSRTVTQPGISAVTRARASWMCGGTGHLYLQCVSMCTPIPPAAPDQDTGGGKEGGGQ